MTKHPSFPGGLDLVAQLNLFGPRDFLLQLEEELEGFVRSRRKELVLPPLARRYQELLQSSVRRFNLSLEALPGAGGGPGWSHTRWKVVNNEEARLPKLSLAEFLRLQRRTVAPPGAFSSALSKATLSEEEILQRLRLRLWAALLCCTAAERAVQVDTLMAPAVEPVEAAEDSDQVAPLCPAKEEAGVKEEAPAESTESTEQPQSHPLSSKVKVERMSSDVGQEIKLERTTSDVDREAKGEHPENQSHGLQELVLNQPKEEKSEVALKAEQQEPQELQEPFAGKVEREAPEEPWVKVRQEPEEPEHQETPGLVRCGSATQLKEEADAPEEAAKMEPQNEDIMSPEEQDLREALRAAFERLKVAAGRWTEPISAKEEDDIATTVHCFRRFSPSHAPGRLYLRDTATAPWPSVKLQRDSDSVIWRPEWMLPHFQSPGTWEEGASMGGIFSWAVEPNSVSFGEGFEVNLRDEPGPCETATKLEDIPERLPNDFLLSFRRGYAAWHFTAGTRGRSGAQKMVPDTLFGSKAGQRQMFWAACLECHDGKHYVLVGTVPGMLSEHFFVAKVARPRPLTHLGFSYLPTPKAAVFGAGSQVEPLWIESITIYPHGLSGELPFISHRFLQVVKEETAEEAGDTVAEIALEADEAEQPEDAEPSAAPRLVLLSKKAPGGEAESRARLEEWCSDARRELGLPSLEVKARSPSGPSTSRKRRRSNRPVGSNAESALTSWGPSSAFRGPTRLDRPGPYEDSLRHLGVKRQPRPGNYRC